MKLDSTQPFAQLSFMITLADSVNTDFTLEELHLNTNDKLFQKCLLGSVADTVSLNLGFRCGDDLITKFLQLGSNFTLDNSIAKSGDDVYPNPAGDIGDGLTHIRFKALGETVASLSVISSSGEVVERRSMAVQKAGVQEFEVDSKSLRAGVYRYLINPRSGELGQAMGRFVVVR